jgi:hypothetical protein
MISIADVLTDKITLDIECVDRVYLNGYVKDLQMPGGLVNFIRTQFGWQIPSPQALKQLGEGFHKAVKAYAEEHKLEILSYQKGDAKDVIAREHVANFGKKSGVVLIGKAQEKTSAYKSRVEKKERRVWVRYSRQPVYVTHYYFYILDEDFGLFFIKIATYCPYEVKVCLNGHEWAKQQLRKEGIDFEELSNGFASCEDAERLQTICHQLDADKIQALFDRWVKQLPWPLLPKHRVAGYRHRLSIWQLEVSRTQIFADAEQGRALVETLIRENLDLGRPDRVSLVFDRRVTKRTPSEFHTRVLREGVLPSIRIRYKHSALKQYLKDGRGLRTEMMFNNPYDFGIKRGIENFSQLVALGYEINQRLLEQEQVSEDVFLPLQVIRRLGTSFLTANGQRASALRFDDQRVMAIFAALTRFAFIPGELSNRTLRTVVAQLMAVSLEQYNSSQMTYDLRRLRLNGIIERISGSNRYCLTSFGRRVVLFFTQFNERVFRPGLAAIVSSTPNTSELAHALNSLDAAIINKLQLAHVQPAVS